MKNIIVSILCVLTIGLTACGARIELENDSMPVTDAAPATDSTPATDSAIVSDASPEADAATETDAADAADAIIADAADSASDAATDAGTSCAPRLTQPTIVPQPLSSTTLASGDMDLYRFQISAASTGSLALKRFTFMMGLYYAYAPAGTEYTLSNFRLRRGSTDLATTDVRIVDGHGNDLAAATLGTDHSGLGPPAASAFIVVSFPREQIISGSGEAYTLHAYIAGTILDGSYVSTEFLRSPPRSPSTGYVSPDNISVPWGLGLIGPHLNLGDATSPIYEGAPFLWSDMSAIPHSDQPAGMGGSRDWTDDQCVSDLTQRQTLTR